MISLHKHLSAAKTDHDKTALERQIAATDDQTDRLYLRIKEDFDLSSEVFLKFLQQAYKAFPK